MDSGNTEIIQSTEWTFLLIRTLTALPGALPPRDLSFGP